MSNNKKLLWIFSFIFMTLFSVNITHGYSFKNSLRTSSVMSDVIIDGNITKAEWVNADWNISFFLDIDNTPDSLGQINVDGNNTLYLGKDSQYLYIALDLCCDRSYNETGEWVGLWLNTNQRTFTTPLEWLNFINGGTESLIYDVENKQPWLYYTNATSSYTTYLTDDSIYNPITGEINGTSYNFQYTWRDDFNITSELISTDHIYQLDFSIDLDDLFLLPGQLDVIQKLYIRINSQSNITINTHKIRFWYNDGSIPPLTDITQVKDLNTGTTYQTDTILYGLGNLTADNKLQFSLYGNHTDPFMINLNQLVLNTDMNTTNYAGPVNVPYSSINTYEIAWDFGTSPGNATDHRMFEIAIPTSELEHYRSYRNLGIVIGGYGTMAFKGTNHWCFSEIDTWIPYYDSSDYKYFNMGGAPPPGIPGYNLIFIIAVLGLVSMILTKKSLKRT